MSIEAGHAQASLLTSRLWRHLTPIFIYAHSRYRISGPASRSLNGHSLTLPMARWFVNVGVIGCYTTFTEGGLGVQP
ncbi:hypothetical protein BAUCODRAFT_31922 [Baudoinia panamericana UAMH 10762]|uniref:Uncharacterized protein n=1 Tax=Baudoinia panamericana (strain UAMH 10762) TaxID=717646 RepID=M2LTQ3_BAUPA|nr:uncharacterized protein BAUCODRAFT_31922 [Baudoinia panamericana UAMH 10762]EMC97917.1 hypothetical protein BAUCODRAFT_31922 [Baudoinia panamericana UAMH 10762]